MVNHCLLMLCIRSKRVYRGLFLSVDPFLRTIFYFFDLHGCILASGGSGETFFLSQTRNSIFFLRYVNLFSSCSGLVRENQSPRPVFSAFSGLAQLFLPPRPARADFSFLFPSCNGIFGSRKSFFLLRTRNKTDKLLHTSIDPKKAKNRSSIKLEKMHPIDWEKIAPGR